MSSRAPGFDAVTKAFTGTHGVDEKSMVEVLVKWNPQHLTEFRTNTHCIFSLDKRAFEKWEDDRIKKLEKEFLRFWNAVVEWTTHPWERDARLAKKALDGKSYGLLIELACTRTSDELHGAKKAFQSLYGESMEESVAVLVEGSERKLLVGLVSAYRYEGSHQQSESTIKSEALKLHKAIHDRDKKLIEDDETIRILTTRSKMHLISICKYYREKHDGGKNIDEEINDDSLKNTINCLCAPSKYFSKVLDGAMKAEADDSVKEALTRVTVTRADVDMKNIADEYNKTYGVPLTQKIKEVALGNYKDFLVVLANRGG